MGKLKEPGRSYGAFAWWIIILVNCLAIGVPRWLSLSKSQGDQYSYVGRDYPSHLQLSLPPDEVQMTFESSVRYTLLNDTLSSDVWKSTDAASGGSVRLGPSHRAFFVSMFHQLHCVDSLFRSLTGHYAESRWSEREINGHVQHCLNYLRQSFLCAADGTKEPDPIAEKIHMDGRLGMKSYDRKCRDWSKVYDHLEDNYLEFHQFKAEKKEWTELPPDYFSAVQGG